VTITIKEYTTKCELRKDKVQIYPGVNRVLASNGNNQIALQSDANFLKAALRRVKIKRGLNKEDLIQLSMETHKKFRGRELEQATLNLIHLISRVATIFVSSFNETPYPQPSQNLFSMESYNKKSKSKIIIIM